MKGKVKLSRRIKALIAAGVFVAAILLTLLGFYIGYWVVDAKAGNWTPDHPMLSQSELQAIYEKSELDEDDYRVLFEQTGLTKIGIDRAKAQSFGFGRVLDIQESYFKKRGVEKFNYAPLVCTDYMDGDPAEFIFLERGDIIISSSTHFSGFRIGHSAIVTDGDEYEIYQSNQVGISNGYALAYEMFANRTTFMVLRIKPEYFSEILEDGNIDYDSYRKNLDRVTEYISKQFEDVPYDFTTGVFTKKDSMKATSCAHLLWYGFKHFDDENGGKFNLDLDSNGRLLVVPKDISKSKYVELVQTFGFDPNKMYP